MSSGRINLRRRPTASPRLVWLRWVVSNMLGGTVAYLAGMMLAILAGEMNMVFGGVIGAIVGLAQWQVLRDYLPQLRVLGWVAWSALGMGLSVPVYERLGYIMAVTANIAPQWESYAAQYGALPATLGLVNDFASLQAMFGATLVGLLLGTMMGLAQYLTLRYQVRQAGGWIAANAIGVALGLLVTLWIGILTGAHLIQTTSSPAPSTNFVVFFISRLALGPWGAFILGSLVTGVAVAQLAHGEGVKREA